MLIYLVFHHWHVYDSLVILLSLFLMFHTSKYWLMGNFAGNTRIWYNHVKSMVSCNKNPIHSPNDTWFHIFLERPLSYGNSAESCCANDESSWLSCSRGSRAAPNCSESWRCSVKDFSKSQGIRGCLFHPNFQKKRCRFHPNCHPFFKKWFRYIEVDPMFDLGIEVGVGRCSPWKDSCRWKFRAEILAVAFVLGFGSCKHWPSWISEGRWAQGSNGRGQHLWLGI